MNFTYENQGAITYLVCELAPEEQLDGLTLGMLTNNHIAGFAPVLYTEMNGQRYLKYNISAKVTADQFFAGSMNKQRALTAFQNILNAICSADDYMIDLSSMVAESDRIYLNVSSCETALICLPVVREKNINEDVAALFKKIMFTTQFDNTEDASYITQLITYINSGAGFTVYGLKDLVAAIQSGAPVPASVSMSMAPVQPAAPVAPAPVAPAPVAPAPSPFDSTISIDDMPAMLAQKQAAQEAPAPEPAPVPVPAPAPVEPKPAPQPVVPQPVVPQPVVPQPAPVQPAPVQPVVPQPVIPKPVAPQPAPVQPVVPQPVAPQPPIQNARPANNGPFGAPMGAKPQPPVTPPPAPKGPGFAIPGQPMGGAGMPVPPAQDKKQPQPPKAEPAGEKKMSLFGLLSHYNKENAELYKKQKEEEKAKKAKAKPAAPAPAPANIPGGMPPAKPPVGGAPMGGAAPQPFTPPQPQFQAPIAPVPVVNSFNETTVLSPGMMVGETTVLSAEPGKPDPALTRTKTGEKISINKPVFRIGKEKSYVDYFIGDNTAISRSHANVHTENGEYFIEDTNSTNHTYVNGKLISSNVKVKLVSGDKVRFANEDFTFTV